MQLGPKSQLTASNNGSGNQKLTLNSGTAVLTQQSATGGSPGTTSLTNGNQTVTIHSGGGSVAASNQNGNTSITPLSGTSTLTTNDHPQTGNRGVSATNPTTVTLTGGNRNPPPPLTGTGIGENNPFGGPANSNLGGSIPGMDPKQSPTTKLTVNLIWQN